ncbi:MAG: TVP38/TMEM64 family protein [Clostridiales bacterium]|nr:TVP38/TMEM64 family protein [Clostridiales bacterium]
MNDKKKVILKLIFSIAFIALIVALGYLIFYLLGWTNLSQEELQNYIESTGVIAPFVCILISFLQVTFVPIPGAITILASNYVFGAWGAFIYSYIGMFLGSLLAFLLGKLLGRPYINWVAGSKEKAEEWLNKLKGKETVLLFFAFLLPAFPDDLLCAIAGILPISWPLFIFMQIITRATSIGATLLFMSGEIIPFTELWGIIVLAIVGIFCVIAFIISLKNAEKINKAFDNFINKIVSLTNKDKNKTENDEDIK